MKKTAHVIPHSHWDREWYIPFEHHRARLIALMDDVLELLESGDYPAYHLDGQTIALEDYLEIRPQKRDLVAKLIREGKLKVGPWYVLQDTYLTGSEANVRNMLRGTKIAKQFGDVCKIGYLPDAFGNAGQFPQMLKQAGMKAAVFGRGVKLMGVDGVSDLEHLCPRCSEFLWESPDGSQIPSIYFANWYNNGMEIPTDPEEAKKWWDWRFMASEKFAATKHLLFMNGCDHQPVQKDLAQALKVARELYPDVEFVQCGMDDYADAVLSNLEEPLEVVSAELEGQQTDGYGTLRNTASARWYIKDLNRKNEVLLEKQAEPMAAMAQMAGDPADNDMFDHAWKVLMQNHPHDSICGCSIDEVHAEMVSRYHRSIQQTQWLLNDSMEKLSAKIAAKQPPVGETGAAFAVWNPGAWARTGVVEAVVRVERIYGTQAAHDELKKHPFKNYILLDCEGNEIPCEIQDLGVQFGYDLPEDKFRQPYFERRVKVVFEAKDVPAFGYASYLLKEGAGCKQDSLVSGENAMENEHLSVKIAADGSVSILDKRTGKEYSGLGVFEDVGDIGDEYVFQQAVGQAITTLGVPAKVTLVEDTHARAAYRVEHVMKIPACAEAGLQDAMMAFRIREERAQLGRVAELVEMKIAATYSLSRSGKQLEMHVEFDNNAKDHRVRALFPTDVVSDSHFADSVFDLLKRPDVPGINWVNPSRCDHMQMYAATADESRGLGIANRGQYEYEILDDRKTIAITLLRAVGELADWGVFPTPEAQCLGKVEATLALIPLKGETEVVKGFRMANEFQADMLAKVILDESGALPEKKSFFAWNGDGLIVTCFKAAADGNGLVLRLFNAKTEPSELEISTGGKVYLSDILENRGVALCDRKYAVGAKEIVTIRIEA